MEVGERRQALTNKHVLAQGGAQSPCLRKAAASVRHDDPQEKKHKGEKEEKKESRERHEGRTRPDG